jgi:hypothetical protein
VHRLQQIELELQRTGVDFLRHWTDRYGWVMIVEGELVAFRGQRVGGRLLVHALAQVERSLGDAAVGLVNPIQTVFETTPPARASEDVELLMKYYSNWDSNGGIGGCWKMVSLELCMRRSGRRRSRPILCPSKRQVANKFSMGSRTQGGDPPSFCPLIWTRSECPSGLNAIISQCKLRIASLFSQIRKDTLPHWVFPTVRLY